MVEKESKDANTTYLIRPIARIRTDLKEKFGIPRQSGLVPELTGIIEFESEFRNPDAVRGLEDYSHIWLIWIFSEHIKEGWHATVRPPRLGGNERRGVFATRAPFRPNPLGLSSVKLEAIRLEAERGPLLFVSGVDLLDQTPIVDIKPYIVPGDAHPDATGGFTRHNRDYRLEVEIPPDLLAFIPPEKQPALYGILEEDPRPAYQDDPERIYGVRFAQWNVCFTVAGGRLQVRSIVPS